MATEEHTPEPQNTQPNTLWIAGGLIALGSILLLHNLNVIPWTMWLELLKLWPLVLILVGLKLILKDSKNKTFILQIVLISIITVALLLIFTQANQQFFNNLNQLF